MKLESGNEAPRRRGKIRIKLAARVCAVGLAGVVAIACGAVLMPGSRPEGPPAGFGLALAGRASMPLPPAPLRQSDEQAAFRPVGTVAPVNPLPAEPRGFVVLGDSLSAWSFEPGSFRSSGQGAWPYLLASMDPGLKLLHNAAVPGNTTSQMVWRFRRDVLAYEPDLLFVLGGTNDVELHWPVESTVADVRAIVRAAHAHGIEVVLLTIPPNNRLYSYERSWLRQTNAALRTMAAREGVLVVDSYSALVTSAGTLARCYAAADGLHLTKSAEQVIAREVYAAMHPQPESGG